MNGWEKKGFSWAISRYFKSFSFFFFFVYLLRLWPCGTTFSWMNAFKQLVLNEKMQARGVREGRLPRESSRIVAFKPSRVTRNSRSPCVFFNVGCKQRTFFTQNESLIFSPRQIFFFVYHVHHRACYTPLYGWWICSGKALPAESIRKPPKTKTIFRKWSSKMVFECIRF